jgi:hypothetical protein
MIDLSKIDCSFIQSTGTCVLASFAIVSNYFARLDIRNIFMDYCKHFEIKNPNKRPLEELNIIELERLYEEHFHKENQRRKCLGYEIVKDLYENSREKSFIKSRNNFNMELFPKFIDSEKYIINTLKKAESLLNISYISLYGSVHSVTIGIGNNETKFTVRDTSPVDSQLFKKINYITDLVPDKSRLADCILYKRARGGQETEYQPAFLA